MNPLRALLGRPWQPETEFEEELPHGEACVPEDGYCFCFKPDWVSGLRAVRHAPKPPEWTAELPTEPGFYLLRVPGAPRTTWRMVDVYRLPLGTLHCSWTDISPRPVADFDGWQWCRQPEPRP